MGGQGGGTPPAIGGGYAPEESEEEEGQSYSRVKMLPRYDTLLKFRH